MLNVRAWARHSLGYWGIGPGVAPSQTWIKVTAQLTGRIPFVLANNKDSVDRLHLDVNADTNGSH